jgi:serine/threonine protein kinase
VAIKLEHRSVQPGYLREEYEIYNWLAGGIGIPKVYWFGTECEYDALVFELLGPSLEDLFSYCRHRFSLKTILIIADQLICRLQYLHEKELVHRDVKPDNLLMGTGRKGNTIYVTDMGLAEEIYERHESMKLPTESHLIGTSVFASTAGHHGVG